MLEKKLIFEGNKKILDNEQVWRILLNLIYEKAGYSTIINRDMGFDEIEHFIKIGFIHQSISFDFELDRKYPSSKINEIDDIKFVTNAMETIRDYREIDDYVYKKLESHLGIKGGEFVLALNGEPIFKVTETPREECIYIYRPIMFEFYNKRGILKHNPNLDIQPNQIELELSVQNQKKEKLLVNMYNKISKYYQEKNFKIIESK